MAYDFKIRTETSSKTKGRTAYFATLVNSNESEFFIGYKDLACIMLPF
jgi:hypothetical protein